MNFTKAKWEDWGHDYSAANMPFGIQLTVAKRKDDWICQMGDHSFVFKQGKSKSETMAKANAEYAFHRYVLENLEKCTGVESI